MDHNKIAPLLVAALLAGAGVGRATVPGASAPKLQRICVEADGSAQVYTDEHKQLLIPPNHALAVVTRDGGKVTDTVPAKLSAAIKAAVSEGDKLATQSHQDAKK